MTTSLKPFFEPKSVAIIGASENPAKLSHGIVENMLATGYKGRIAIFEMLEMNNQIRELAFSRAPAIELRKAARNSGMRTLLEDGKLKVFRGVTTLDEVAKKSMAEGLVLDV